MNSYYITLHTYAPLTGVISLSKWKSKDAEMWKNWSESMSAGRRHSQIAVNLVTIRPCFHHLACNSCRSGSGTVEVESLATSLHGTAGRRSVHRLLAFTTDGTLLQQASVFVFSKDWHDTAALYTQMAHFYTQASTLSYSKDWHDTAALCKPFTQSILVGLGQILDFNDVLLKCNKIQFHIKRLKLKTSVLNCVTVTTLATHIFWVLVWWWWWFYWSFAHLIAPVVTTPSLSPIQSRVEIFWYRLTQVHLENVCLKQRERERERERDFLPDLYHYHTCTVQNLIQLLMNAMITVSKGCSNSTVYYPVFYITEQIINHGKKLQMMHFVTYLSYLS